MIRSLPVHQLQKELRLFAVACVRRIWHLLPEQCRKAVDASERFADGQIDVRQLECTFAAGCEVASTANRGSMAPDASAYATSAAVDASSIGSRTANSVLAAATCAASAAACAMAEMDEANYDAIFDATLEAVPPVP